MILNGPAPQGRVLLATGQDAGFDRTAEAQRVGAIA